MRKAKASLPSTRIRWPQRIEETAPLGGDELGMRGRVEDVFQDRGGGSANKRFRIAANGHLADIESIEICRIRGCSRVRQHDMHETQRPRAGARSRSARLHGLDAVIEGYELETYVVPEQNRVVLSEELAVVGPGAVGAKPVHAPPAALRHHWRSCGPNRNAEPQLHEVSAVQSQPCGHVH